MNNGPDALETPRMRISASKLKTWSSCALQARFQYTDRLPRTSNAYAAFGSCVHHALSEYNTDGDIQRAVDVFTDVWHSPEKIGSPIDVWPRGINYSGSRTRGIKMLTEYHEKMRDEPRDIIAIEHPFLVPFGSYEIQGIVDLLEVRKSGRGKNTLRVVDYKTNKKKPFSTALFADLQFTLYDYAVRQKEFWVGTPGADTTKFPELVNGEYWWEMLKGLPKRGIWYHLETQSDIDVGARDNNDYMRAYRICQQIERAEKFNVHVPTISGDSCGFCPFTKECGLPVERFEVEDEDAWI